MTILVTGVKEKVGWALLAELASQSIAVRVLTEEPSSLGAVPANVEVIQGDLSDEPALRRALQGVDAAFLASPLSPQLAEQHLRFVSAAKAVGVPRIVQLSGIGADSGFCCARALRWWGQAESGTRDGAAVAHVRPAFLMQHVLKFYASSAGQGVLAGPFRSGKWTFVDARDVAAVIAKVLLDPQLSGRTYTVTSSESLTFVEVAERLSRVLDKPVRYVDITANEARGRLQALGAPPIMIEATLELWDACASNLINVPPTSVVRDVTGREPRSFEQFAQDHREYFR